MPYICCILNSYRTLESTTCTLEMATTKTSVTALNATWPYALMNSIKYPGPQCRPPFAAICI